MKPNAIVERRIPDQIAALWLKESLSDSIRMHHLLQLQAISFTGEQHDGKRAKIAYIDLHRMNTTAM